MVIYQLSKRIQHQKKTDALYQMASVKSIDKDVVMGEKITSDLSEKRKIAGSKGGIIASEKRWGAEKRPKSKTVRAAKEEVLRLRSLIPIGERIKFASDALESAFLASEWNVDEIAKSEAQTSRD